MIALHSAGVAKTDADGHYLDKDGQVIEVENGWIDESRVVWLTNRGVRVSAIMQHLLAPESAVALHPLIQGFSSPAYTDSSPINALAQPRILGELALAGPTIAAPPVQATRLRAGLIKIRIRIGNGQPVVQSFVNDTPGETTSQLMQNEKNWRTNRTIRPARDLMKNSWASTFRCLCQAPDCARSWRF